jgi:polysaccharide biosynthesis protein PelD
VAAAAEPDIEARPPPVWLAALETGAVTIGTVMLGYWLRPDDPFFIDSTFTWSALGPLLMGLRYGFAHGFGCALGIIVLLVAAWRRQWVPIPDFPSQYAVGLLVAGMLAGEFADVWIRRVRRQSVMSNFRRLRLDEFARAYHVLKVSHDALEQKVAGGTQNLREALQTLRRQLLAAKQPGRPLLGIENAILALFSHYGWVQTAALFSVDEKRRVEATPAATMGKADKISPSDPLVEQALDRNALCSVRPEMSPTERGTELLAVIPFADSRGRMWAVLAVREMLFVAFHADNLKLLAVLGGHVGDILAYGAGWSSADDGTRDSFLANLARAVEDRSRFDLPAVLVSMAFARTERGEALSQQILGQRRGLDQALLLRSRAGETRIFMLMPFTDERGAEGYLGRLRRMVQERYGADLEAAGLQTRTRVIGPRDNSEALFAELCQAVDVGSEGAAA